MREALARVKRDLGPHAVILGTRSTPASGVGRLIGRDRVEITAVPPDTPSPAPRTASSAVGLAARCGRAPRTPSAGTSAAPALPEQVYPYFVQLVQNEVSEDLAERLLRAAVRTLPGDQIGDGRVMRALLRRCIARMIPTCGPVELPDGARRRIALVGPPGGGKTTTLAKLAAHIKLRKRKRVALLTLDMHRLAANQQLERYAELVGVPLETAQTESGVEQALERLPPTDCVLIDTSGVGLREQGRLGRVAALLRAARADEVHLVLPASTAVRAQVRIAAAFAPLGASRVVLTRLDEAVGFGVVLNAMDKVSGALSYVTAGQKVPQDIEEACSRRVAELILPLDR